MNSRSRHLRVVSTTAVFLVATLWLSSHLAPARLGFDTRATHHHFEWIQRPARLS
jgi:hypothetical protein